MKHQIIIFISTILILFTSSCNFYKITSNHIPKAKKVYKDTISPVISDNSKKIEIIDIDNPKMSDDIKITDYNQPESIVEKTNAETIIEAIETTVEPVQDKVIEKTDIVTTQPIEENPISKNTPKEEAELAPSEQKWRPYYFPISDLKNAKAYQYIARGQFPDTTYRLMRTMELKGQSFLITEEYNRDFGLKSIKKEKINGNGVFVENYSSYETGDFGEANMINCGIIKDDYINWAMNENTSSSVQFNYNSNIFPGYDITINKKIELINTDEIIEYEGEILKAITFKDVEATVFTNHKNVSEERYKLEYINQYAKGVGLVRYAVQMVNHPTERPRTYELSKVLDYSEWNNLISIKSN